MLFRSPAWNRKHLPKPPADQMETAQGRYTDGPTLLRELLQMAGIDRRTTEGKAQALDILQERSASFVPRRVADAIAKEHDLSVEELIRYVWYTVDATATSETSYSVPGSRAYKYSINWVEPNRIISPGIDVTGDGKGDFTAIGADGSIKFVSADKYVGKNGRLRNRVPGAVPALAGATLVDREIARTERDGSLAVLKIGRAHV